MRIFGREISVKNLLIGIILAGLIIVGLIVIWWPTLVPPTYP